MARCGAVPPPWWLVAGGEGEVVVMMWPSCDECGEHESDAHLSRRWCRFGRWGGAALRRAPPRLPVSLVRWYCSSSCRRRLEEVADARLSGSRTSVVGCNLFIRAARAGHSVAFFSHRFSRELARAKCGERVQELWSQIDGAGRRFLTF